MRYIDPFDAINRIFAEVDHTFREAEDQWHVILPTINVPSVSRNENCRVYTDGQFEKHFKNGMLHREDGPAVIEYDTGGKIVKESYFIEGEKTTKEVIEERRQKLEDERIHNVYLGNKAYRVTGKELRELEKMVSKKT